MQSKPHPDIILQVANYFLIHSSTVRATAAHFNISKSTVHNYLSKYLIEISPSLHEKVQALLNNNFDQKHLRGGIATKLKYERSHTQKDKS